jgi:DtxR family Mn-dependent transcriptional regulator
MTLKQGKPVSAGAVCAEFEETNLSAHMEDYIESIIILAGKNRVVRVKDIAKHLGIKMPSVTAALAKLKERGLIHYEKYGFVELTEKGRKIGGAIYRKHSFLKDFFHDILRMGRESSDREACRLEHHLSPEAFSQINRLMEFYRAEDNSSAPWTRELRGLLDERPLSELREGDRSVIVRIAGNSPVKKRLSEMGFRRGEKIKVVKYAPLRDPMELALKDYHLSLRVSEARDIIVRPQEDDEG